MRTVRRFQQALYSLWVLAAVGCAGMSPTDPASCNSAGVSAFTLSTVASEDRSRFEPSGIAVVGSDGSARAYLVNDKDKDLAYYWTDAARLDGSPGIVKRVLVERWPDDPDGFPKWEDAEPCRGKICGQTLSACKDGGCFWMVGAGSYNQDPHLVLIDPASNAFAARTTQFTRAFAKIRKSLVRRQPEAKRWAHIEALAQAPNGRLLVGVRQAGTDFKNFSYRRVIFEVTPKGRNWRVRKIWEIPAPAGDGCQLGISGLTWSGRHQGYLATFSVESDNGVWSELVVLKPDRKRHFAAPRRLVSYDNKAEGVSVDGDTVIVVFDSDGDRKGKGPGKFPIESYQDYYETAKR